MTGQLAGLEQQVGANPSSPLFARLADILLKNGEISRAIDVCQRGIEAHPEYSTGKLVYARSLAARDRFGDAVRALSPLLEAYPGNILLEQLVEEWEARETPADVPSAVMTGIESQSIVTGPPPTDILPSETDPEAEQADVPESEPTAEVEIQTVPETVTGPEIEPTTEVEFETVTEPETGPETISEAEPQSPLNEIPETAPPGMEAAETSGETQTVPDDAVMMLGGESHPAPLMQSATGFVERDRIISRTLAEIYASQGATAEAVETYRLLIERIPGKQEVFGPRLKELEEKLRLHPEGQKQHRE